MRTITIYVHPGMPIYDSASMAAPKGHYLLRQTKSNYVFSKKNMYDILSIKSICPKRTLLALDK